MQERGGTLYVWGDPFPSRRWGWLRAGFERPEGYEFQCEWREGFELCVESAINVEWLRISVARFPREHIRVRWPVSVSGGG